MFEFPYTLQANETKRVPVPYTGRFKYLKYQITATDILKVFLVDSTELDNIRKNINFKPLNKQIKGDYIEENIEPLKQGMYHLIIYNPNEVAVSYNFQISA